MNVILVAKKEFAAYLVNSEDLSSIKMIGLPDLTYGAYNSPIKAFAFSLDVPTTTLSGFMKSSTATPSRKNSGLETTSTSTNVFSLKTAFTLSAVPTGTVDLVTITL